MSTQKIDEFMSSATPPCVGVCWGRKQGGRTLLAQDRAMRELHGRR